MRLYRSAKHENRWFSFAQEIGWVMFPPEVGGYRHRQPSRSLEPLYVREVSLHLGFNARITGVLTSSNGTSRLRLWVAA
jgi:hypothetical protein